MSYKNDHLLTISNKYGKASGEAKAELFSTYDKLRDLTVSGPTVGGSGFGKAASFLMNLSQVAAPAAFMPTLGNSSINVPGTSYSTAVSGGNQIFSGGTSAFGYGDLGSYPGLPSGEAAPIEGVGSATGYAATVVTSGVGAAAGMTSAYTNTGGLLMPLAGLAAGLGGIMTSLSPYYPALGITTGIVSNVLQGSGGAALGAYQYAQGKVLNNADTVLQNRVKNIETVVKMLNTQSDVIKKLLKEEVEGASKAIQDL